MSRIVHQCFTWKIREKNDCPFEIFYNPILNSQIFVIASDIKDAKIKIQNGFNTRIMLNADVSDLSENDEEEKLIRRYIFKEYINKNKPSVQNISKMIISVGSSNFPINPSNSEIEHFLGTLYFGGSDEKSFIWNIDSTNLFSLNSEYFKYLLSKDILMPCELELYIISETLESARDNIELKLNYAIWINQNDKYFFTEIEKKYLLSYLILQNPSRICGTIDKPIVIVALN